MIPIRTLKQIKIQVNNRLLRRMKIKKRNSCLPFKMNLCKTIKIKRVYRCFNKLAQRLAKPLIFYFVQVIEKIPQVIILKRMICSRKNKNRVIKYDNIKLHQQMIHRNNQYSLANTLIQLRVYQMTSRILNSLQIKIHQVDLKSVSTNGEILDNSMVRIIHYFQLRISMISLKLYLDRGRWVIVILLHLQLVFTIYSTIIIIYDSPQAIKALFIDHREDITCMKLNIDG